jgi:hypothetical protein
MGNVLKKMKQCHSTEDSPVEELIDIGYSTSENSPKSLSERRKFKNIKLKVHLPLRYKKIIFSPLYSSHNISHVGFIKSPKGWDWFTF